MPEPRIHWQSAAGKVGVKRNFWLAKFLTSGHLRMRRAIFQIRNFACISGVCVSETPDHLFHKRYVSVTAATKVVYWPYSSSQNTW